MLLAQKACERNAAGRHTLSLNRPCEQWSWLTRLAQFGLTAVTAVPCSSLKQEQEAKNRLKMGLPWEQDSSVVRAPDWWSKGCRFKSWQKLRENFPPQDQLFMLLFRHPFHPCVTTVAYKRSCSFCQKWRWLVTAEHACTLHVALHEVTWHGAWLYGVHGPCRDSSSFTRHQPCRNHKAL